jgi:hypothetical protein
MDKYRAALQPAARNDGSRLASRFDILSREI